MSIQKVYRALVCELGSVGVVIGLFGIVEGVPRPRINVKFLFRIVSSNLIYMVERDNVIVIPIMK